MIKDKNQSVRNNNSHRKQCQLEHEPAHAMHGLQPGAARNVARGDGELGGPPLAALGARCAQGQKQRGTRGNPTHNPPK